MNEAKEVSVEVFQPSALAALESAQIDVQVRTAHQFPRSLELFKKRSLAMATLDEEVAESCIYVRPVGKKDGKMQYAEGASIRMAEIVAASYGNIRVASRIIEQTDRFVKCEGVAHDLESNYAAKSEAVETTVTREGQPFSEGMRAVVAKACLAKAFRDATFKVVPRALCKPVYDAAKNIINGKDKPLSERIKRVQAWLASIKVDDARVFAVLEVKGWAEVSADQLTKLTGIKTSIGDGDTKIEDAFPAVQQEVKKPDPTNVQQSQTGKPADTKKTEPEKKTLPSEPAKAPESGEKAPGKPPAASGTVQQPSQPANAAPAPSGEQPTPPKETVAPKVETFGDLPANPPNPPAAQAPSLQPIEFVRSTNDTDEVAGIKMLACQAGLTETHVMNWAKSKGVNLAKEAQKVLSELATGKLLNLGKAWQNNPAEYVKQIRAVNVI